MGSLGGRYQAGAMESQLFRPALKIPEPSVLRNMRPSSSQRAEELPQYRFSTETLEVSGMTSEMLYEIVSTREVWSFIETVKPQERFDSVLYLINGTVLNIGFESRY
jgi:hypothetical protein